jgi:hypothetical protein
MAFYSAAPMFRGIINKKQTDSLTYVEPNRARAAAASSSSSSSSSSTATFSSAAVSQQRALPPSGLQLDNPGAAR